MIKLLLSVLTILLVTGCSTKSHLTYISNQVFSRNDFSTDIEEDKISLITGDDTLYIISFVPTKMTVTLNEALDDAFEQAPHRDLITNVDVKFGFWWIPYIYGQNYWTVEGSAIKSR